MQRVRVVSPLWPNCLICKEDKMSEWKPKILVCEDPDNCDGEDNHLHENTDHLYGCECDECMQWVYLHLK